MTEPLSQERRAELELISAVTQGQSRALTELDAMLREEVARAVRPLDPGAVDEVTQLVREHLLVAQKGTEPRISTFRAEAPLRAWLRAVALRTALNTLRSRGREVPVSQPPDVEASSADPELALLRARYRDQFREAFAVAVASLTPRERTVLRLHTLDGVTLARIGTLYQKDTSTISRWLEQVRTSLLTATRAHLATRLQLDEAALDSVMRAADPEMSVSLHRLLAEQ